MALPTEAEGERGLREPSIARIRDYWLGGSHHSAVDREFADRILVCAPQLPYLVRGQRSMLQRMVRYLLDQGVRQFLDLGSGVPTGGYVHEVTEAAESDSRVVYVDIDPHIVHDCHELLADDDNVTCVQADIRDPGAVLAAGELNALLDLHQPVAVLMIETLLHIPDSDDPEAIVAGYRDALAPGSHVGLSHFSEDEDLRNGLEMFARMFGAPPAVTLRGPEQLTEFLAGLELVEPGVVPVPLWRPSPESSVDRNPEHANVYAGLGRKR